MLDVPRDVREECDPILNPSRRPDHALPGLDVRSHISRVQHHPARARDPAQHRQRHAALREHGRPAAPRQATRVSSRREIRAQGRARLPGTRGRAGPREPSGVPRGTRLATLVRLFHPRELATTTAARFEPGDALLFGAETRGLPDAVLEACPVERRLRIPMLAGVRSLNLSQCRRRGGVRSVATAGIRQPVSDLIERFISAKTASRGGLPS